MSPDHDASLKNAFAQLHRRTRADAPPFALMHDRALHETREGLEHPVPKTYWLRLAALASTACIIVAVLAWWPRNHHRDTMASAASASRQEVESLLSSIEHQLAVNDAIFDPVYPTDFLIATDNELTTP